MRSSPRVLFGFLAVLLSSAMSQDIVAHRGASYDAPENTLAAFLLAWEQGADAIEGDFRLTKDGHIVCVHDEDFKRTASFSRRVSAMTLAEVRALDVGSWKGPRFAEERVPTLSEVLATIPTGKRLFLEIKCGPEIVEPLKKAALMPEKIVFICFDAKVIAACREQFPDIKAHWLTSFKDESPAQVMKTLADAKASGLDVQAEADKLTRDFVKGLRDADLEFHAWTVDDLAVARRLRELGIDSITTNRPAWLRAGLKGRS